MPIERIVHHQNPFVASDAADEAGRRMAQRSPATLRYFEEREVLDRDGAFPFGEGYLYDRMRDRMDAGDSRAPGWSEGRGVPGEMSAAGDRGTKHEQQDSFGAFRIPAGEHEAAVVIAADGVSASGDLASPASKRAQQVFVDVLGRELRDTPSDEAARHTHVEDAMKHAAFAANFEVVRQVLFDRQSDGAFDAGDRDVLRRSTGIDLPEGNLTPSRMRAIAPRLDAVVENLGAGNRTAMTTFAVAVAIGNDVYTYSCGDAVVGLYRPTREAGKRVIHLTRRDQQVTELFERGADPARYPNVYQNVITQGFGFGGTATGTLHRYPNLLEPGDRVFAATDGIGPRDGHKGLDRVEMERIFDQSSPQNAARALVDAQLRDLSRDEYQDNIGVAVLGVA